MGVKSGYRRAPDIYCPFYKRDSSRDHCIICEGPHGLTVSMIFGNDTKRRTKWMEDYCFKPACKNCWLYKEVDRSYE